jgi:CheY-like chemotaxis protein
MESGHQGLGIGLTLVKRLVEMHGGEVDVESAGRNRGTTFRIRLPSRVRAGARKVQSPDAARPTAAGRQRVLVVDDNEDALKSLSMLVSLMGNDVCQARDGLEAVEQAEQFRPDVVLMDIGMPRLNGYDAACRIRQQPWGMDIVLIATTGWGQEEDRRRTKAAGFDHHLVKPLDHNKLQVLLEQAPRRTPAASASEVRPREPTDLACVANGHVQGAAMVERHDRRQTVASQ